VTKFVLLALKQLISAIWRPECCASAVLHMGTKGGQSNQQDCLVNGHGMNEVKSLLDSRHGINS
jgi:hypothetical protein